MTRTQPVIKKRAEIVNVFQLLEALLQPHEADTLRTQFKGAEIVMHTELVTVLGEDLPLSLSLHPLLRALAQTNGPSFIYAQTGWLSVRD